MDIYDIFKQLNIEFKETEHEPIFTIEQAQNIKNRFVFCFFKFNI